MPNINSKTYIDVHTTGEKREFGSIRQYDRFLKEHGKMVLSKKELAERSISKPEKKMSERDLRNLAEKSWSERNKYIPQIRENILKQQYEQRNGRR